MWKCELIENGIVKERVFREGATADQVRAELEIFQWPKGEWRITPTDTDEEED